VSEGRRIREVFEYALKISRNALQKAEWIVAAGKTKAPVSQNMLSKMNRYVSSIKQFIQDIASQEKEWMRAVTVPQKTNTLSNWPLTPLSKHGSLPGMHYKTAYEHASPDVAVYMNEVGHIIEQSMDEIKRHKVTRSTYGFNQARTRAELDRRLRATQQTVHPSLQPYVMTSYQKALKHL
jgi:hypothetical protein